jgi:hypothetical protein
MLGASTLSGKGTPGTGCTGTPIIALMSFGVSSDYSLHNQASVVILSDNHMAVQFLHQSRKSWAGTVVEVLPLILSNHLSNRE